MKTANKSNMTNATWLLLLIFSALILVALVGGFSHLVTALVMVFMGAIFGAHAQAENQDREERERCKEKLNEAWGSGKLDD